MKGFPLLGFLLSLLLSACPPASEKPSDTGKPDTGGEVSVDEESGDTANSVITETCNGLDDDGDGYIDEGATDAVRWCRDTDGDGYGSADCQTVCDQPAGYVANGDDCDDHDAAISPTASEICDGRIDEDCDGEVDEVGAIGGTTLYRDADDDRYGDPNVTTSTCDNSTPSGYVTDATDCDDGNNTVHPGMFERCNDIDDDCNGEVDDNPIDPNLFPLDGDRDGWGQEEAWLPTCDETPPDGTSVITGDCDDEDADVNPDADEVCDDVDNDCDGVVDEYDGESSLWVLPPGGGWWDVWYEDADGDSYGGDIESVCDDDHSDMVSRDGDCDDTNEDVNPDVWENCADDVDNDCDDAIDSADEDCTDL